MPPRINSCPPDCPGRSSTCHATCKRYKDARAIYEKEVAQYSYNVADEYMYDSIYSKKNRGTKSRKKNSPYKGRLLNFK